MANTDVSPALVSDVDSHWNMERGACRMYREGLGPGFRPDWDDATESTRMLYRAAWQAAFNVLAGHPIAIKLGDELFVNEAQLIKSLARVLHQSELLGAMNLRANPAFYVDDLPTEWPSPETARQWMNEERTAFLKLLGIEEEAA